MYGIPVMAFIPGPKPALGKSMNGVFKLHRAPDGRHYGDKGQSRPHQRDSNLPEGPEGDAPSKLATS